MWMFQSWMAEVHDVGFAGVSARIPRTVRSINQLAHLCCKLIFASTCQHSATHTEALDLYGFVPGIPAMMRQASTTRRRSVTRDVFARTLPDQFPDAYYGSLATVLQIHRPEEVQLEPNVFLSHAIRFATRGDMSVGPMQQWCQDRAGQFYPINLQLLKNCQKTFSCRKIFFQKCKIWRRKYPFLETLGATLKF